MWLLLLFSILMMIKLLLLVVEMLLEPKIGELCFV